MKSSICINIDDTTTQLAAAVAVGYVASADTTNDHDQRCRNSSTSAAIDGITSVFPSNI